MENTLTIQKTAVYEGDHLRPFDNVSDFGLILKLSSSIAVQEARSSKQLQNKAVLVEKDWRRSEGLCPYHQ
jgi:hypothetical protein